jgi:hypothetical protein
MRETVPNRVIFKGSADARGYSLLDLAEIHAKNDARIRAK